MYSIDKKETKNIEIDIHPISKWKRILVYLADLAISFIIAVILMNVVVMPIYSAFNKTNSSLSYQAEKIRDDILYEHELLFYRNDQYANYDKYNFDSDLVYTYNRFLAYYVFTDTTPLNEKFPEYTHQEKNEVIKTYFVNIRSDSAQYLDLFTKHNQEKNYFVISGANITLKQEIIDEIRVFFKPNESLGKIGQGYYDDLSSIFSALYGCVIKDIYENDLTDTQGHSFKEYQAIIKEVAKNFYLGIAICAIISYVLAWAITRLVYPLINKSGHTIAQSFMKVDRLGVNNLYPISRAETALMSAYHLFFDLPYIMFLSLSYTTFIYSFSVPIIPILSLIGLLISLVGLFIILFNPFNRSATDLLSQSVLIASEEVDGIIKAKETIRERQMLERKENNNGQRSS